MYLAIRLSTCAHLRLAAACGLLELLGSRGLTAVMTLQHFHDVAYMIHDSCVEVRAAFVQRLHALLMSLTLPVRHLAILFLGTSDPSVSMRQTVRGLCSSPIRPFLLCATFPLIHVMRNLSICSSCARFFFVSLFFSYSLIHTHEITD